MVDNYMMPWPLHCTIREDLSDETVLAVADVTHLDVSRVHPAGGGYSMSHSRPNSPPPGTSPG